jgi:hypothetical protein
MVFPGRHALALVLVALGGSASANLIVNGDFEAGNTGFASDYAFSPGNIVPAATYEVLPDPSASHGSALSYGDHTTGSGLMMAVNGSTTVGDLVWGQTVSVVAGSTYDFAAWISSWVSGSPAQLVFTVNGDEIGALTAPLATGVWDLAFATWDSGTATSATIEIRNANTAFGGNDFALDDLFFGDPVFSDPTPAPEPGALALLGVALGALRLAHRRR